jgi:Tol biopolymer transport system component
MESNKPHKLPHIIYWVIFFVLTSLACATLVRGASTITPSLPATFSNGLIAYVGTDGNLYTIERNGDNKLPVTQDAQIRPRLQVYQSPTWSSDGRHLAFVSVEISREVQTIRLLVYTPETGGITEIFSSEEEAPFYLYWSPDNETVSFLTSSSNTASLSLHLAFLNGNASQIADTGQPYYWVWSPDGKEIFVHKGGSTAANPNAQLLRSSLQDGNTQTFNLASGNFQSPAWSVDGDQLLAAVTLEEQNTLSLLDQHGAVIKTLTEYPASIAFSWSPDGKYIAYIATTLESGGILGPLNIIDTVSPDIRKTTFENTVLAYFWSPDSQKIAYFTPDRSDGNDVQVRSQAQNTFMLTLHIMEIQTGVIHQPITFEPTTEFLNILPFFDQYHHSATIWSPDSKYLTYTSLSDENVASVWVISEDGGTPNHIADGTLAFWSWK